MLEMYDATDGRVDSMYLLNAEVDNSVWVVGLKLSRDGDPEFPQLTTTTLGRYSVQQYLLVLVLLLTI